MRRLLFAILFSTFYLFPSQVSAQVVINEFNSSDSSDWIEIYNISSTEVLLSGWLLKDTASSPVYEFSGQKIPPLSSCVQSVSNRLNNGGDKIQLFNGSTQIDCVSYGDGDGAFCGSGADVSAPASGQTASRIPDGTGSWNIGASSQSSTNCSSLIPTSTPTSSPTSTATSTPTPTPTKTPTPVPTSTKSPTPKPSSTSSPTSTPEVLGDSDEKTSKPVPSETPLVAASQKNKIPVLPIIFISSGLLMLGLAILQLMNARKNYQNP